MNCFIQSHFHAISRALGIAHRSAVYMHGSLVKQNTTAYFFTTLGKNSTTFAFDGIPGIPAHLGHHQAATGFYLFHHSAQSIHMAGQTARGVIVLAGEGDQQGPLAGQFTGHTGQTGKGILAQRNGQIRAAGGAGSVEQIRQKPDQAFFIDLGLGHNSSIKVVYLRTH
ncbi:hypothetical protein SDC9_88489 [bioreactor metagenome]|uniref:Uncharacterized protein n=1 Tax=bioreactor metagenome TaxID=1076179 RepID=A0A644ZLQ1_9ZZZZ